MNMVTLHWYSCVVLPTSVSSFFLKIFFVDPSGTLGTCLFTLERPLWALNGTMVCLIRNTREREGKFSNAGGWGIEG